VTVVASKNPEAFVKRAAQDLMLIGADHRAKQVLKNLTEIIQKEQKIKRGILLVVGNEESGIPDKIREQCTLVSIAGSRKMESLNVAQAATLFLHEIYQVT
jgi:TrmH RNA methyltransferase